MVADVEEALPRGIALTWGVAENPQRGPKRELSIERIVETAIEIADAEGLGAVSMSRVATTLGFTTMSLYRYVTSKDDLLVLMEDTASEMPIPAEDDTVPWRDGVRRWVLAVRGVYRDHPWIARVPVRGAPMTPNNLLAADWLLRELRPLPLDDSEKMSSLLLLTSYVRATAALEADLTEATAAGIAETAGMQAALTALVTPERFPDLSRIVAGGGYTGAPVPGVADDFTFGLERILDGIEYHVGNPDAPLADTGAVPSLDTLEIPRDKAVREAAKARREAEARVREAKKREREEIKRARERAARG
ncbi:TetR/AcrR family transcriptional regulator [Leifsonia flava]|uniref:TetR/AcrR family transcriptional regulator n=1 Tax=Orlajensenia leifsoniae TaxID=2561933 RepID=A0A4Y9QVL9_9MICO|nr:TetR/AcrR family transcriptional regulator [Leifsonia flava]